MYREKQARRDRQANLHIFYRAAELTNTSVCLRANSLTQLKVSQRFFSAHSRKPYTEARRSEQSATVDTLIFRWLAYTMGDALLLLHCCHCIMYIWPSSALCAYIYIYIKQRYGHDVKFILCKFAQLNVGAHSTRTDRIVVFAIKWSNM